MIATIFARSSGAPPAAISVLRVSGPRVEQVCEALLGRIPPARRATLVTVRDPATGEQLDRALALFFPAPASATGEDVLELHVHGGRAIVSAVERAIGSLEGLRTAEPGEFTRRAVANGRLDLLEAEALGELLAAETEVQRRAVAHGSAHLRETVEHWLASTLALAADVEAAIDNDLDLDGASLSSRLAALAQSIAAVLERPSLDRLRDGFLVVLGGAPNTGKSTLFNALLDEDAAIVSPVAGTTRDVLERTISLRGIPVRLVDTAGVRAPGADTIEAIGIARAAETASRADLLLWLDATPPPPAVDVLRVQSMRDRRGDEGWADLCISPLQREGIADLVERIHERLSRRLPSPSDATVNARQRSLLSEVAGALAKASFTDDLVIAAADLADARRAFDQLTGRAGVEDMLDAVFSRFCLGK